jgi:putative oxidoreductase
VQRLYSTFANGWPGRGLLLLRLALSTFLIARCLAAGSRSNDETWLSAIMYIASALVAAGLWTPISGGISAILELWAAFTHANGRESHLLAAAIALGLAVLGPGAWSIDARLFGRRRISIQDGETRKSV